MVQRRPDAQWSCQTTPRLICRTHAAGLECLAVLQTLAWTLLGPIATALSVSSLLSTLRKTTYGRVSWPHYSHELSPCIGDVSSCLTQLVGGRLQPDNLPNGALGCDLKAVDLYGNRWVAFHSNANFPSPARNSLPLSLSTSKAWKPFLFSSKTGQASTRLTWHKTSSPEQFLERRWGR